MKNRIFLGGTCADTTWRETLLNLVQVDMFNPVVKDWTPDCQATENAEKERLCNIHFYLISKKRVIKIKSLLVKQRRDFAIYIIFFR